MCACCQYGLVYGLVYGVAWASHDGLTVLCLCSRECKVLLQ